MNKKTLIHLEFNIDIEKMCDYQMKQFLKHVKKRLVEYRAQYDSGQLKPTHIVNLDLPVH